MEVIIFKWVKQVGDFVEEDEIIFEIVIDKVDFEVFFLVDGVIQEICFQEDEMVEIGKVIVIIGIDGEEVILKVSLSVKEIVEVFVEKMSSNGIDKLEFQLEFVMVFVDVFVECMDSSNCFYLFLVCIIVEKEDISMAELEQILGFGLQGRVIKKDILVYVENCKS